MHSDTYSYQHTHSLYTHINRRITQGDKQGCFYPTYPSIDFLYKCVPTLPKNITEAAKSGLPQSADGFLMATSYIASPVGLLGNAASELQVC